MSSLCPIQAQCLGSFTKFNQLPPELRIKIWQFAMPDARTIAVHSSHFQESVPPRSLDEAFSRLENDIETWQSNAQIPALLHVNAEARYEALKHYTLSLAVGDYQPRIYVDFKRDTIFFGDAELKPGCSKLWASTQDLEKVERLAVVPEGAWRVLRWKKVDLNALQKIIFVHDTEKLLLGPTPELVEDEPQAEVEEVTKNTEEAQQNETTDQTETKTVTEDDAQSKRMQEAREELNTLMTVLPTQWDRQPSVATGVFKKTQYDRWVC